MRILRQIGMLVAFAAAAISTPAAAQVTTSSMAGTVKRPDGTGVAAAVVSAVHQPSGSVYTAKSRADGRFTIPGMRVGGPYTVTARAIGFAPQSQGNIFLDLGVAADIAVVLSASTVQLKTVAVTAEAGTFSSNRTGAATRISSEAIAAFPTIGRTITDFTRLTPQAKGSSFGGQDNRFNNITLDGSTFNNSFGLSGQPGGRTGVSPIPLDAIDQIQVNIAPFDVRQGSFVGAGVNAVTKSGTNEFSAATYYIARNQDYVGTMARNVTFNPGTFKFGQTGFRLSGPIVKDRLFFFANYEDDKLTQPGTTFQPLDPSNPAAASVGGLTSRTTKASLDSMQQFLSQKFGYQTGAYQGWNLATPSKRTLVKLDFNANDRNKFSLRYTQLNSSADQPMSNSNSLGFGNRRDNLTSFAFANSGYAILENIRSTVGEWNAQFGSNMSNNLIVGYTKNDESRKYKGSIFPMVDILDPVTTSTYMSFGFEPFTPANQLRYQTFQAQDNFTIYTSNHDLTFGGAFEKYNSQNVFFPGSQSAYVYKSLADFYTDANDYIANPTRTTSPVRLRRFEVRYNNIPGQTEPLQPLEVFNYSAYAQDQWRAAKDLTVTFGLRMDINSFTNTAFTNTEADGFTFRDRTGTAANYSTKTLPSATPLWSPRIGFSWFANESHATRLRGGTGIFTGKPAFVWISNQIGQNGVITGFSQLNDANASPLNTRPFNPNPDTYKPLAVTGAPAASYELNFTDKNFKFPQLWRSNLAIDQKLPGGFIATLEGLYGRDVNGMYYYQANLPNSTVNFTGIDQRPRWLPGTNQINSKVTAAYTLANQSQGYSYSLAASLEKSFENGFFAKAAYNYGKTMNTIDPGSIAGGTWAGNTQSGNPNNVGLGYSSFSPGHRYFVALSYRKQYFGFGATTFSVFGEGFSQGNTDYTFAGDLNGDGATSNDLIYIAKNTSEMNFQQYTITGGPTFTAAQQAAAWDKYIAQDPYLSKHRGEYMQRGALFLPVIFRADVSLVQDLFVTTQGKKSNFQIRLDILNAGNLIKNGWGVGDRLVSGQPLTNPAADAGGAVTYRLRAINNQLMTSTFQKTVGIGDVYRFQLGLRYNFN